MGCRDVMLRWLRRMPGKHGGESEEGARRRERGTEGRSHRRNQNPGWGYRAKDLDYRKRPEKVYASALPPVRVRWHVAAAGLRVTDAENVSPLRLHEGVWVGPVGREGAGRG